MEKRSESGEFLLTPRLLNNLVPGIIWVWGVWVAFVIGLSLGIDGVNIQKFALVGDSLGTVNALFSGLAVIFVVLGLREQQKEIKALSDEAREKRIRDVRAGTPVLIPEAIKEKDFKTSVNITIRNLGPTLFMPEIEEKQQNNPWKGSLKCTFPFVLPHNSSIEIELRCWPPSMEHLPELDFKIYCFDMNGKNRVLRFSGLPTIGGVMEQIENDFPIALGDPDKLESPNTACRQMFR